MLDYQFFIHASKGQVIIVNQIKPIYNNPFKDSHSHPIHTCFPIIASNESQIRGFKCRFSGRNEHLPLRGGTNPTLLWNIPLPQKRKFK